VSAEPGGHTSCLSTDRPQMWLGCKKDAKIFATVFPRGLLCRRRCEKNRNFQSISRFISEMIQDRAIVTSYAFCQIVPFVISLSCHNLYFKVAINNSKMVKVQLYSVVTMTG